MTPEELEKRGKKLFGRRWKAALAKELKKHLATVYRWLPDKKGKPPEVPVPDYVDMFFDLHEQRKKLERFAKSLAR